jgi:outer membrane protein assembly factor BamB
MPKPAEKNIRLRQRVTCIHRPRWQVYATGGRKENAGRILNEKGELDFSFTAGTQDLTLYETSVDVMNEFYNLGSIVSSPAISGNVVYFGSADGYLYALERKN